MIGVVEDCRSNFSRFWISAPNEKGDTLAGVAGSLAFLWIIVTVLLQWKELALQRDEIEKMRVTQEQQTALLSKQSKLLDQSRIDDQIAEWVAHLQNLLPKLGFPHWQLGTASTAGATIKFFNSRWEIPEDQAAFGWWKNTIEATSKIVLERIGGDLQVIEPKPPVAWESARMAAAAILELYDEASPKQKTWLDKTIQIRDFHALLADCLARPELWAE